MKLKIYTKSHNEALLRKIDNSGGLFTAEEHSYVMKTEFEKDFESKESILRAYLSTSPRKLSALAFLIEYVNAHKFDNIISLGAGHCVLEYLLKCAIPEESNVVAVDFDSFLIEKTKLHFPSIIAETFDFFKDDIGQLQDKLDIKFDLAIFWGASYVMDDPQFIHLFNRLRQSGVKQIIDFHAGYLPYTRLPLRVLNMSMTSIVRKLGKMKIVNKIISRIKPESWIRKIKIVNKIIRKISPEYYRGKFHGYCRTRGELRRLYKKAGLHLLKETPVRAYYKYIAILKAN